MASRIEVSRGGGSASNPPERTHCARPSGRAAAAGTGRENPRDIAGVWFADRECVYSYQTFPSRTALARTLLPSTVAHVLLLLWLALVLTRGSPGVELYAVDLISEARPVQAPTPAAVPAPEPPPVPESVGSPGGGGVALGGVATGGVAGPVGDGRPPAYVPPAAQAGRVLTAPGSASDGEPMDFSVVQGSGEHYAGGVTSSRGTSKSAVYDARARDEGVAGVVGGTGTGGGAGPVQGATARPAVVAPRVDRSRPALPVARAWSCAFPPAADTARVDFAQARIVATVGIDGRATSVTVISDPGTGFGAAARRCALSQRFTPALDRDGRPRVASTAPITVTFTR